MTERIRAAYYRGGTSRAVIFRGEDLPQIGPSGDMRPWDDIFTATMGSPDASGRQLDGMGGGVSSLSKVAVVSPSQRQDADVDYTFAQVGIDNASVGYLGNCGNISSAVGYFAVEEGMVAVADGEVEVRIFNTNTEKMLVALFEVHKGLPRLDGDLEIDGVSGAAAPIKLSFLDPSGAVTGRMFPTGQLHERLRTSSARVFNATMIDVANPTVIVAATELVGQSHAFDPKHFEHPEVVSLAEEIRVAAAVAMGIAPDVAFAQTSLPNLPLVSVVLEPRDFIARSGRGIPADRVDIITHMFSAGLPHKASPVTGAMALAAAVQVPGTVAEKMARVSRSGNDVRIGHPSGVLDVAAECAFARGEWRARQTALYRTARRLFEGKVLVPTR